jgi:acyl carrier protein
MNSHDFLVLFAEALETEPSAISMETVINDVPEWTSLVWLTIMSILDERCSIQLSAKEIRSFTTVGDCVACISMKNGATR